jgi:hypothetical protein
MSAQLREHLGTVADGLLYISESEAPFEFVTAPLPPGTAVTAHSVARAFGEGALAREVDVGDFFASHIDEADPADGVAQRLAPRFAALVTAIEEHLHEPRVYCYGEVEKRCYIVGQFDSGLAGLRTTAWET